MVAPRATGLTLTLGDRTGGDCAHPHGSQARLLQPINMDVGAANPDAFFTYETRFGAF
jgi:hypothetical protein